MVRQMPVVIEPEAVEWTPDPEVARPAGHMPLGAVVMDILHGRPHETEAGIHHEVMAHRDPQAPHQPDVQGDGRRTFETDYPAITRVERFHERLRSLIHLPIAFVIPKRHHQKHHVRQHHHHPIKPGQDPVPHQEPPHLVIPFEIEIKRLVVGTISQVMTEMSLPDQVEGRGEKQRQKTASQVVPSTVLEQHGVLGLMDGGID